MYILSANGTAYRIVPNWRWMKPDLAYLITRPFWLDEWHTALVANRPSLSQVFSDLRAASDMGPPVLHVIAWSVARFTGGALTPVGARLVSLVSVLLALVFVFLTLRRRFGVTASVAGALAVASHQTVIAHAFELRYYCLWLAFAAGVGWALGLDHAQARSRRRDVVLALLSILLCLTHWVAAMSLGLLCLGAMASYGRDWRRGFRRVFPAAAGVVALAISLPLVLAQRAAVGVMSWMPDATVRDVLATLSVYWYRELVLFVLLAIVASLLLARFTGPIKDSFTAGVRDPGTAALLALLALPLLMAVLSTRYPAMHLRYSIVTVLAWAPIVAMVVQPLTSAAATWGRAFVLRGAATLVFLVLLLHLWAGGLRMAVEASTFAASAADGRNALAQACASRLPVVFQVRHLMYPSTNGRTPQGCDARYLAVSDSTLDHALRPGSHLPRFFRFENEISRLHERLYDFPRVTTQSQLDSVPRFVLVGWDESIQGFGDVNAFGRAVFPNHSVTRVTADLAVFAKR